MQHRNKARPALYELMKGQRIYSPGQPPPVEERRARRVVEEKPPSDGPTMTWLDRLRAGNSLRIPIGYLFVGIPVVLIIIVVAYIFGFSRGETAPTQTNTAATPDFAVNDPLARPLLDDTSNPTSSAPKSARSSATNPTKPAPSTSALALDISKLGPIESDPRQPGMNYYVVATTHPSGAVRLAEFCREHGLAAFVVEEPDKPHRRQVVLLPGFDREALKSDLAKEFKQMILDVGHKWDNVEPGPDDLSSCIPQLFSG